METVLVVGSTGHIGVSAVIAALRSKRHVLAVVRNQTSAKKLFKHVGTQQGITTVEADIMSEEGIQGVVDQVRAGNLPAFQHVFSSAGGLYSGTPLTEVTAEDLRSAMNVNFESNFFAYRATIPYLLEQKHPDSSWTLCTGSQGEIGVRAVPAMTQGALFSMANAACRENADTNIRFNELYLAFRVEVDEEAAQHGTVSSSDFSQAYENLLSRPDIRGTRVNVLEPADVKDLKFQSKIARV